MEKDYIYWIDIELSIIHILIYTTMGLVVGGKWWILFGGLIAVSIIYILRVTRKMKNKNIYK